MPRIRSAHGSLSVRGEAPPGVGKLTRHSGGFFRRLARLAALTVSSRLERGSMVGEWTSWSC